MSRDISREGKINKSYVRINTIPVIPPSGCPDIFPIQPCPTCPPCPSTPGLLNTVINQYTAFSDGIRKVYTNNDAVISFSTSGILAPNEVSFVNLFINGILQSPNLYVVQPGALILSDVPAQGVPLILQFIKITTS